MKKHNLKSSLIVLLIAFHVMIQAQLPGMFVSNRFLYSATGDTVILKGFNAMIVYWDIHGNVNFPEIEKTGANCVRIFWKLDFPTPQPSDLDKVLDNCIKHHMIPIICLWDATGNWSRIQFCVDYWCSPAIAAILKKYERHLIVNIANEPGNTVMEAAVFRNTYSSAVQLMRNAGIHTPIMIDADSWGRNADSVLDNGEYLLEQDPDHNIIFSWHLWDPKNWGWGTLQEIDRIIAKAATKKLCFVVGEFGPCEQCDRCVSTQINWEYLMEKAYKNKIGYLPWVWKWADCHSIVNNNTGAYGSWVNPPWGATVAVTSSYSIKNTSKRPSELSNAVEDISEYISEVKVKPNPFAREIEFNIKVESESDVELGIFDINGKQVAVIKETRVMPGDLVMRWVPDSDTTPSINAFYIYRIKITNSAGIISRAGKIIRG